MPRISKRLLSFPVLIEVAGTAGSGFFVNDGRWLYLVTAKHVLFKQSLGVFDATNGGPVNLTFLDGRVSGERRLVTLDCRRLFDDGNLVKHSTADVAVCRMATIEENKDSSVGRFRIDYLAGITEHHPDSLLIGAHVVEFQMFDDVESGGDIILFGYPTSLANNESFEKATPLLRTGIVAGKTSNMEIVIDCPVYFGNSGALVAETFPGKSMTYLGVAVRMIPFVENLYSKEFRREVGTRYENSGYAIVEPMDRVLELIQAFYDAKSGHAG